MKIVQIRGANGSGKTSIVKDLLEQSRQRELLCWERPGKRDFVFATVMKDFKWAVIGKYPKDKKMGGCDNFDSLQSIYDAILDTHNTIPTLYGIILEGMMITAIKTPVFNYLLKLEEELKAEPIIVNLKTTLEGCVGRIEGRGTRKPGARPLNLDMLSQKVDMVIRYGEFYGKYSRWIDVERTKRDNMLPEFLRCVDDEWMLKTLYE